MDNQCQNFIIVAYIQKFVYSLLVTPLSLYVHILRIYNIYTYISSGISFVVTYL